MTLQAQERFLHHVLGFGAISQQQAGETEETVGVLGEQPRRERSAVDLLPLGLGIHRHRLDHTQLTLDDTGLMTEMLDDDR